MDQRHVGWEEHDGWRLLRALQAPWHHGAKTHQLVQPCHPALEIQVEYWQAGLGGVQGKERQGPSGGREVSVHMKTFETLNCIQGIQSKHSTLLPAVPSTLSPPTLKFRM